MGIRIESPSHFIVDDELVRNLCCDYDSDEDLSYAHLKSGRAEGVVGRYSPAPTTQAGTPIPVTPRNTPTPPLSARSVKVLASSDVKTIPFFEWLSQWVNNFLNSFAKFLSELV
jgi:hypothetical protein